MDKRVIYISEKLKLAYHYHKCLEYKISKMLVINIKMAKNNEEHEGSIILPSMVETRNKRIQKRIITLFEFFLRSVCPVLVFSNKNKRIMIKNKVVSNISTKQRKQSPITDLVNGIFVKM